MLKSNRLFYGALKKSNDKNAGTLLFDVFFEEKALIYGVSKVSLAIAKIKGLNPLGIIPQNTSKDSSALIDSMCFSTSGGRASLLGTFLLNLISIVRVFAKVRDRESFLNLTYDNCVLGTYIYDAILRAYSIPTINKITYKIRFRLLVEIIYFFHFKNLIKVKEVKFIVCSDNVYRYGLLFELAKANSIPCVSAVNLNDFSMTYYRNSADFDVHCRRALLADIEGIDSLKAEEELKKYFGKRYSANIEQHDVIAAYSSSKRVLTKKELCSEYHLNQNLPVVILMAHIFCDAPHGYPNALYDDYYDWVVNSIRCLSKNEKVNFLVKEHPSAALYGEEGILLGILNDFGLGERLLKDDIHNTTVLNQADVVVTCGGTIGQEFSYMKKSVVLAAKPPYSGFGFTYDGVSVKEYESYLLDGIQDSQTLSDEQFSSVNKVLYYDFILQCNYRKELELGGQRYYLGRDFDYELFYKEIIGENLIAFEEQAVYEVINDFISNSNRHVLNKIESVA